MHNKNNRSIKLDKIIEDELKIMVDLGIDYAPISQANLFKRLVDKKIISSKGTLSKTERNNLIEKYKTIQKNNHGVKDEETKYGSTEYYKRQNQKLQEEINQTNKSLSNNTSIIVEVIKRIESQTPVKVEDLLQDIIVKPSDTFIEELDAQLNF